MVACITWAGSQARSANDRAGQLTSLSPGTGWRGSQASVAGGAAVGLVHVSFEVAKTTAARALSGPAESLRPQVEPEALHEHTLHTPCDDMTLIVERENCHPVLQDTTFYPRQPTPGFGPSVLRMARGRVPLDAQGPGRGGSHGRIRRRSRRSCAAFFPCLNVHVLLTFAPIDLES